MRKSKPRPQLVDTSGSELDGAELLPEDEHCLPVNDERLVEPSEAVRDEVPAWIFYH